MFFIKKPRVNWWRDTIQMKAFKLSLGLAACAFINQYCYSVLYLIFQIENKSILWSWLQEKIWIWFNPSNSKSHSSCPELLLLAIFDYKNQISIGTNFNLNFNLKYPSEYMPVRTKLCFDLSVSMGLYYCTQGIMKKFLDFLIVRLF